MAVYLIPVEFFGIDGAGPGLVGLVKTVEDRAAYTVSEMVSARKPILPPPSVIYIDAVL